MHTTTTIGTMHGINEETKTILMVSGQVLTCVAIVFAEI